jgi:UDP-N-acetylglucosamine 2-epimerase (non-hydrolysing)
MARKIRVLVVMGTRPEAIKLAPVVRTLHASERFEVGVCATAQHRQMLDQVLDVFEMRPTHDLNIMQAGQDLYDVTARVVVGLREVFARDRCDMILVQGDTTTVFAGSLAAYYAGVTVGHVEAGLRTRDKRNPFPEEINRRLTSVLTDLHFAPTTRARDNLLAENVFPETIHVTGNTVVDALLWALEKTQRNTYAEVEDIKAVVQERIGDQRIVLITAHRRESFGQPFRDMCGAMRTIATQYPDTHLVYPVHLNPNVLQPVHEVLDGVPNVHLIPPLSYLAFVWLMNRSHLILTDSGGIQEEAPSLGKPVLVMRETTERPEGIQAGTSILVGRDPRKIVSTAETFLSDEKLYRRVAQLANPYGDGRASLRITETIGEYFDRKGSSHV